MKDHIMIGDAKILIDPEDHEKVSQYSWHIQSGRDIVRCKKLGTMLHMFILGVDEKGRTAYHINGNSWNNRKSNLVECSVGQAVSYNKVFKRDYKLALYANEYIWKPKTSFM